MTHEVKCQYCPLVYATAREVQIHENNSHSARPITEREPTPLPSESEKFFRHLNNGEVELKLEGWVTDSTSGGAQKKLWPSSIRLYIPSGDLVEGFEYYEGGKASE